MPRKRGPGITQSDLLVINKIDIAPMVGASLEAMERDARRMRGERPFVFTNLKTGQGQDVVECFIVDRGKAVRRRSRAADAPAGASADARVLPTRRAPPPRRQAIQFGAIRCALHSFGTTSGRRRGRSRGALRG